MLLGKRLGLVAAALWARVGWAAEKNIVVVIADDLSPTLGCYGDMTAVTPNIDRLAADGTLFRYAFATTASCSASRSVVLTGLHNHRNGHYGHLHSYHKFSSFPWVKTLPVLLAKAGYRTARIGKHHNGPEEVYFFETKIPGNSRSTVEMANNCEEFIKADSDKPFFLYYATSDPHRGGGRATELEHQPDRFGNKPNKGAYPGVQEVFYDPAKVAVPPFLPDTPETRAELAQYYQSTSRVDQGLGRLVEILKKNGKWDNTLILFTSDHGMAFAGGYDAETQATMPELATMKAGRGTKKGPYKFHGRSFMPILAEKNPVGWDQIGASHTFHEIQMYYPMRVVRDRKYKLIWNIAHPLPYPFASDLWAAPSWQAQWDKGPTAPYGKKTVREYIQRPQFELFDISVDPNEGVNLAGDEKYAKVLEEYQAKLKSFQNATQDPWVMKWKYE